jgi:hypothetical protein
MFLAMPDLLRSAMLAIQKGESGKHNMPCVHELVILIIPALVEALKVILFIMVESFFIISGIQYIWHIFSIDYVRKLVILIIPPLVKTLNKLILFVIVIELYY